MKNGNIKKKNPIVEGIGELIVKKTVALRVVVVIKSKSNIFKNYSSQTLPRKNFFAKTCFYLFFPCFLTIFSPL